MLRDRPGTAHPQPPSSRAVSVSGTPPSAVGSPASSAVGTSLPASRTSGGATPTPRTATRTRGLSGSLVVTTTVPSTGPGRTGVKVTTTTDRDRTGSERALDGE